MKITLGNKQASITLTTQQDRYVRELLKRTTGTALDSMERTVNEIYDNARSKWPVGTKKTQRRSRDQIVKGVRLVADSKGYYVGGYIGNDAPWSYYIKSTRVPAYGSAPPVTLAPPLPLEDAEPMEDPRARHAFTELIRKPFNAHLSDLAEELQRETARLARTL